MVTARHPVETGQPSLLQMHHPEFRRGYQAGRKIYFEHKTAPLTDKELLDSLEVLVQEGLFVNGDSASGYYTIGQLMGQLSGRVIPLQAQEDDEEACKERVLAQVRAAFPNNQEAQRLAKAVKTLWNVQDFLACHLDADTYENVLQRTTPPTLKRL